MLSSSLGFQIHWERLLLLSSFTSFFHPRQNSMAIPGGSGTLEDCSILWPRLLAETNTQ